MVARLQQCFVLGSLLGAIAWASFWWSRSPSVAVLSLIALTCTHTTILAVEFVASYRINGHDPISRARVPQCIRAWLAESWLAPRVFCWYQPFRSRAVHDHLPANGRRGVVLVHGFLCNRGFWTPWLRELRIDDRAFVAVDLEPVFGSIDHYAQTIDDAILRVTAATSLPPMLICHSMGGLAARAWLRDADPARVHRIVTIGTPHRGTWLARFGRTLNGRQMRVGGEWMQQIEGEHASTRRVPFTCWYTNCDNIVFPTSNATLPGADNRLADGCAHVEMAFDLGLRRATLALLDC
ncbi:esterase/lipase family protein [Variovorax sp. MHTC-1]|uniref:esterase/lipase family protein n=1 Tax=Variovorax sp. MHTC-1 TaxID=2495593 RepID=UPI000F876775|nr:alpha/beta fold hydrolase [Variovorax sp. MHTC-1]RST51516.1 alpha/beta fold hydrolase [Variovorax sp. MHTC-1]